jgi:hypothetical protein
MPGKVRMPPGGWRKPKPTVRAAGSVRLTKKEMLALARKKPKP